jgi:hypothetical protein
MLSIVINTVSPGTYPVDLILLHLKFVSQATPVNKGVIYSLTFFGYVDNFIITRKKFEVSRLLPVLFCFLY